MNQQPLPSDSNLRPPESPVDNSASLIKRFAAVVIDWALMLCYLTPAFQYFGLSPAASDHAQTLEEIMVQMAGVLTPELLFKLIAYQYTMFFIVHGYFLSHFGQTIGKRAMGLAIVTLEGRVPPFYVLAIHRYMTQWAMGFVPGVSALLRLTDWLFVLRQDRRCIHDHLAKTRVIDLKLPVSNASKPSSLIV